MQVKKYYDIHNRLISLDISSLLMKVFSKKPPIIVCLGSDKVLSDMVGVFVADYLKLYNIKTFILGGTMQNANKNVAKLLAKYTNHNLLFIDSGALCKDNTIMFSNKTKLNDGSLLNYPSITCSTIKIQSGKILLANVSYSKVLKYSKIVAQSIRDYFSYLDILSYN